MPNDDVVIVPKLCPEFPVQPAKDELGRLKIGAGFACVEERCAKYQACQVLPVTMAAILEALKERLP